MKIPKVINKYCPKCGKVTPHEVIRVKSSKKRGSLSKGARIFKEKLKGYGGFPRPKPEKSKRYGVKATKKVDIRLKCKECGYEIPMKGFRTKKLEIVKR